jgi:hypothetical protein
MARGTYEYDKQMDSHIDDRAANKDTEVLSDILDVQCEEIGQDQEEDTNRCQLDKERNDLHHDLLNLSDCAEQRRVGSFDQASNHNGRYEHS